MSSERTEIKNVCYYWCALICFWLSAKSLNMIIAVHPPNRWCHCRVEVVKLKPRSGPAPSLFWEEFQTNKTLIIEYYTILNKRNVLTPQITTLATQQVLFMLLLHVWNIRGLSLSTHLCGMDLRLCKASQVSHNISAANVDITWVHFRRNKNIKTSNHWVGHISMQTSNKHLMIK